MKACGESDFYRNVFTLLVFTNQTHLMQLTVFGNITVMRFFLSPLTVSGIQPVDTSTGGCGCECAGG